MDIPKSLLLAFILLFSANAFPETLARTTARSLDVRISPDGGVVDTIPKNTLVELIELQDAWVFVQYVPGYLQEPKQGWIDPAKLRLLVTDQVPLASIKGDHCSVIPNSDASACVTLDALNLRCYEHVSGSYYESCEAPLVYSVSTNFNGGRSLTVGVECALQLVIEETKGHISGYRSDSVSETYYLSASSTVTTEFDFSFYFIGRVTSAKIDSVSCVITSVY